MIVGYELGRAEQDGPPSIEDIFLCSKSALDLKKCIGFARKNTLVQEEDAWLNYVFGRAEQHKRPPYISVNDLRSLSKSLAVGYAPSVKVDMRVQGVPVAKFVHGTPRRRAVSYDEMFDLERSIVDKQVGALLESKAASRSVVLKRWRYFSAEASVGWVAGKHDPSSTGPEYRSDRAESGYRVYLNDRLIVDLRLSGEQKSLNKRQTAWQNALKEAKDVHCAIFLRVDTASVEPDLLQAFKPVQAKNDFHSGDVKALLDDVAYELMTKRFVHNPELRASHPIDAQRKFAMRAQQKREKVQKKIDDLKRSAPVARKADRDNEDDSRGDGNDNSRQRTSSGRLSKPIERLKMHDEGNVRKRKRAAPGLRSVAIESCFVCKATLDTTSESYTRLYDVSVDQHLQRNMRVRVCPNGCKYHVVGKNREKALKTAADLFALGQKMQEQAKMIQALLDRVAVDKSN